MEAEIEVLDMIYDGLFSDELFNPYVPDEPMYMDYSDVPVNIPEGNLDITELQTQLDFPVLFPSVIPENYTFSGWYYEPDMTPAILEFDCGRGTTDWWAFVVSQDQLAEEERSNHLLRSFITVGQGAQIETVMIGNVAGEYM